MPRLSSRGVSTPSGVGQRRIPTSKLGGAGDLGDGQHSQYSAHCLPPTTLCSRGPRVPPVTTSAAGPAWERQTGQEKLKSTVWQHPSAPGPLQKANRPAER